MIMISIISLLRSLVQQIPAHYTVSTPVPCPWDRELSYSLNSVIFGFPVVVTSSKRYTSLKNNVMKILVIGLVAINILYTLLKVEINIFVSL